jgi:hypothetical protein
MAAFVDRIPGALALIAAFRGDAAPAPPADTASSEPKYGRRFIANTLLLAVVGTLASVWFAAHVKPHVSIFIFGTVSLASLGLAVTAFFWTFVKKDDVTGSLRRLLRMPEFTRLLLVLLPPIAIAYATTCTLYLTAVGEAADVRLNVTQGTSSTPVTFTSAQKQRAVTYFFALRPVTVRVETLAPTGYKARELPLRRGIPTELTVPDRSSQKTFSLVRLMPLYNLFQLRGRSEPDPRYVVRVFLPGVRQPIERTGLTFGAIYLGASLPDLDAQSKAARGLIADLRNTLRGLDSEMKPEEINDIVADWLDKPEFMPTPELKPGDRIRVVLESPGGTSETTVTVAAPVNTAFLSASAQGE